MSSVLPNPAPPAAPATLAAARVLVVGAGGLGCPASLALARAGVGHLTLCDPDLVDPTNLHRQLWHHDGDVGRLKVESAAAKLRAAFPGMQVEALPQRLDAQNAEALFGRHHLVIDGTDGIEVKFLLSDAAVKTQVPLVYAGVLRLHGQTMLIAPGGPCLRCLFETPPPADELPTCAQAGVLGSMAGVIGFLQAALAVEWLGGARGAPGMSALHVFDAEALEGREVRVRKAADCPACAAGAALRLSDPEEARCRV